MHLQRKGYAAVAAVGRGLHTGPYTARTVGRIQGIGHRRVQVYLVVRVKVRQRKTVVLRVEQRPMVGDGQGGVAPRYDGRLRTEVELRETVVVGVTGYKGARRKGQGGRLHDDKEGVDRPAAVLAVGGHEDLLLGADDILVGRGVGDRVVVHLVDGRGVVEHLQGRVPQGDQRRVHRKVERGKAIVRRTAVHKVVALGQVVPDAYGREELKLKIKGRDPRAAGDTALKAHPDGLPAHAYIGPGVGDRIGAAGGVQRILIIGDGKHKVRRVLDPQHALVLQGKVKDRRTAAALVATDKGVGERRGDGHIGKVDHPELELHNGKAAHRGRRNVLHHPGVHDLAKGHDIGIGHRDLRPGDPGNGICKILIVQYGNVRLARRDVTIGKGKVPAANDAVVVIVAELQGVRGGIRVRVGKYRQGKGNQGTAPKLGGRAAYDRLRGGRVLEGRGVGDRDVRSLIGRVQEPLYRDGGIPSGDQHVLAGKVKGRDLIVGGTALELVVAEHHLEGAQVRGTRVHDKGQGNDVVAALADVRVRRDGTRAVANHKDIDVLRVGAVQKVRGVRDRLGKVRGGQRKVAREGRLGKVLVIVKVKARRVQGAQHLRGNDRQVEEREAVGHRIVALAERPRGNRAHGRGADLERKGNDHRTAADAAGDARPNATRAIVGIQGVRHRHVQVDLVVHVRVGKGEHPVLGIQKGTVVGNRKNGVTKGDHRVLLRKVKGREAVVVNVALDQVGRRHVDRRKGVDDKVDAARGIHARGVVTVLKAYVDRLPGRRNEIGVGVGIDAIVGIGLAAMVGDVVARGRLAVQHQGVELRGKVNELAAIPVGIAVARVDRNDARDRTAEKDTEVRKVETATAVVLDARIDRLRGRGDDDVNTTQDLVGVVKTVLVALVVLYREERRVLTAQNVRVVVRQIEHARRSAVVALVKIHSSVRNGLGPKSNDNRITIYPTDAIYCFNRIYTICCNRKGSVSSSWDRNTISKPLNVKWRIGNSRI